MNNVTKNDSTAVKSSMRALLCMIVGIFIIYQLFSPDVTAQDNLLVTTTSEDNKLLELITLFESDEEPTTLQADWISESIFVVGVMNDNTKRNGYAQYVCTVLNEHGFNNINVQVVDATKMIDENELAIIGYARCE